MADELLMAYSVLNASYRDGLLKKIEGPAATDTDTVAEIKDPDDTYVPIGAAEGDPKLFSYAYGQDPAVLVAKVTSVPGSQPSGCAWTLAAPEAGGDKAWKVLARDVVLKSGGRYVPTNPYGVAQMGTKLFIIDYDSPMIYPLGVNELNGLPAGPYELATPPFDLSAHLPLSAKGQAIIAINDPSGTYLFALYTDYNLVSATWGNSILVRIRIDAYGNLEYVDQVELAPNAQELLYVTDFGGTHNLLIPSIGGPQNPGTTNGENSKIEAVDPFAETGNLIVKTLITGDPAAATPTAWDIRALAARADDNGPLYILTGTFDEDFNQNWTLYHCSVNDIQAMTGQTLSDAVDSRLLAVEDFSSEGEPGSYWDIYYESGTEMAGGRLWFLKGSPIRISNGTDYSSFKLFKSGTGAGQIGGENVDSVVLIAETMRQVARGVSLKRGLRGVPAPTVKVSPEEEEKK